MARSYRHANGRIQHRSRSGKFRKTTLKDMGIDDGNTGGLVFICNVCGREFVPVVLSGKCCGVDNKRLKEIVISTEEKVILDKIAELRGRPFISRQMLTEIEDLHRELGQIKQQKNLK